MSKRAGLLALLAAIIGLAISLPFAAAFYLAYPGFNTPPFWWEGFRAAYAGLFEFAAATRVYQIYGRIYSLLIPLTLPALFSLRTRIPVSSRAAIWGRRVFIAGVVLFALGIIGDYWPDPNSQFVGAGFLLEMIGTPTLWVGSLIYGLAVLRNDRTPRWVGAAVTGIAPLGILGSILLNHIPSGPLFGYAVFSLVLGTALLIDKAGDAADHKRRRAKETGGV